jgi:hypothetical protein
MGRKAFKIPLLRASCFAVAWWVVCPGLVAQEPPILKGEWTATAGPAQVYRGRWIGQALPGQPNALHGSWTLSGQTGKAILSGTWSARKSGRELRGTWAAQDQYGRSVSGTWGAAMPELAGLSLQQMLELSLERTISGTWRSGRLSGYWWISGSPATRSGG